MEEQFTSRINNHLSELVKITVCSSAFLAALVEYGVLGFVDLIPLILMESESEKAAKLYCLIIKRNDSYSHFMNALQKTSQIEAFKLLQLENECTDPDSTSEQDVGKKCSAIKDGVRFDIWPPVLLFTGRLKELSLLHKKLQESELKPTVISQMASVVGLGGIGKSELARRYIEKYNDDYDGNLIWINAETEEALSESFHRLASDYLGLSLENFEGRQKDMVTVVDEVYTFFQDQKCLFIFDNAESTQHLQTFMPFRVAHPPYILMTSRDMEWEFSVDVLLLEDMLEEEAVELVKKGLQIKNDEQQNAILKLVNRLQRYPLALSQAISYIKQRQMVEKFSISQYLDLYEASAVVLLNSRKPNAEFNLYKETTFTTWKVTTDQIISNEENGQCAMKILNLASYFLPDQIPMETFSPLSDDYDEALHLLVKYSMVTCRKSGNKSTLHIHRLVQEVTKIELRRMNEEEKILTAALRLLADQLTIETASHTVSVYSNCQNYKRLVVGAKVLVSKIVALYFCNKKFVDAQTYGVQLLEILQPQVSSDDKDILRTQYELARVDIGQGNHKKCLGVLNELLPKYLANEGKYFSASEVLAVEQDMAVAMQRLGDNAKSLKILVNIFKRTKAIHGENYWQTVESLVIIIHCLQDLSINESLKKGERIQNSWHIDKIMKIGLLLKSIYEINAHLVGRNLQWTNVMYSVAQCLYKTDREFARQICRDIFERTKNLDGEPYLYGVRSLNLLGMMKQMEKKHEEALAIYQDVYSKQSRILGSTHSETLFAKNNIFIELFNLGMLEISLEGFRDVEKTFKKYHPTHPDLFCTQNAIVGVLLRMKKFAEALELCQQMGEQMYKIYTKNYPLLLNVRATIALIEQEVQH